MIWLITSAFMSKVGAQRQADLRITSSFNEITAVQPALHSANPGDGSRSKKENGTEKLKNTCVHYRKKKAQEIDCGDSNRRSS